jgi:dipeptidyl aminopeptidase/acylaminoacyl peptidase
MPTLAGWHDDQILYTEQAGVSVNLFAFTVDGTGALLQWHRVPIQFPAPLTEGNGVIGGGFRSTSRVSVVRSAWGSSRLGFSYEQPVVSQQAFLATLNGSSAAAIQISSINAATLSHSFIKPSVVSWPSDDNLMIDGILFLPPGLTAAELAVAPAIVFTHCGPAMAVMATFQGYGSVCARFPLEALAEAGFVVLQPNYRGSTG